MATKESTIDASDEWFDYVCSPCNKKDRNSEAVKFCLDYQEYLCDACVEHHNSFSVLAGHKLTGRSAFGSARKPDSKHLPPVPTERCKEHSLKVVDMYCADHDSVGCSVCFTINHKPCQGIHYIPEYVETTKQHGNIRKVYDDVKMAISEIQRLTKRKQKDIANNRKTKVTYLKDIKAFRTEINEALDILEQASVAELEDTCSKLDTHFRGELTKMQDTLDTFTTCKAEIESSQSNLSQQFVNIKISENLISQTEKNILIRSRNEVEDNLTFERNSEILHFLQTLESLAKRKLSMKHKHVLYEVQTKESYNVKLNSDINNCSIWSSCILDCGDILMADYDSQNIKLVDSDTFTVRNSLKMSDSPRSVCKINSVEAAVSLYNKTVQFVSTNNQLMRVRLLKFDHDCRGIPVMGGQLVICENGNNVYIYTTKGERVKSIERDRSGNDIFIQMREFVVSSDDKMIHVVDYVRGLVTRGGDGIVVWKVSGQELKSAWRICTDGNDNVIASGELSRNVVQLGSDGKLLGEVVSKAHGFKCPQAVCFDAKQELSL